MRKTARSAALAPALTLLLLLSSCGLDGWGWFWSSDVDDRFRDSEALPAVAAPSVSGDFSFIVIADTHVYSGWDRAPYFSALASRLIPGANGDRFVLACGDLVENGSQTDTQSFKALADGLGIPVYPVPGNHDLFNGGWTGYRGILGRSHYAFSAGPLRVIAIDSANGTLGALQRGWLEGVLASRTEPYCVTFTHFEFFSDKITETQQWTDVTEIYSLMHLLETSGVDVHFTGHSHRRLEREINGTRYCTADELPVSFMRVTVTGSGISYEYIGL